MCVREWRKNDTNAVAESDSNVVSRACGESSAQPVERLGTVAVAAAVHGRWPSLGQQVDTALPTPPWPQHQPQRRSDAGGGRAQTSGQAASLGQARCGWTTSCRETGPPVAHPAEVPAKVLPRAIVRSTARGRESTSLTRRAAVHILAGNASRRHYKRRTRTENPFVVCP
jgi:hypothetical protein